MAAQLQLVDTLGPLRPQCHILLTQVHCAVKAMPRGAASHSSDQRPLPLINAVRALLLAVVRHPMVTVDAAGFRRAMTEMVDAETDLTQANDRRARAWTAFRATVGRDSCSVLGSYVDDVIAAYYDMSGP